MAFDTWREHRRTIRDREGRGIPRTQCLAVRVRGDGLAAGIERDQDRRQLRARPEHKVSTSSGDGLDSPRRQEIRVAVGIATYRRIAGLRRLLVALNELSFRSEPAALELIVVDNDSGASARQVCRELGPKLRWPLSYVIEASRGIPQARNRAVETALRHGHDAIAFIDDDEEPSPDWLDALLTVRRAAEADVVTGPVLPRFEAEPPRWVVRGRFFERRRYDTGRVLDHAFSHNALAVLELFRELKIRFDETMALTGGSDQKLFEAAARQGMKIVWADDAVVYEWYPPSRARASWLLRRAFRTGCATTSIRVALGPSKFPRLAQVTKGLAWLALGLPRAVLGLAIARHVSFEGVRRAAYGAGLIAGTMGLQYREYDRTHGT